MTTKFSRPWAGATINGEITQTVTDGRLRLDAMGVPYASGTIVLPITELSDIDDNDPRDGIRAIIDAGDDYDGDGNDEAGDARQFNLGIRGRTVDHVSRTVEFELASDEALLQDYAPLTETVGARAFETSVRSVCNYVLEQAITYRRNLAKNPSGTSTAGYAGAVTGGGAGALTTGPGGPAGLVTTRIQYQVTTASASAGYIDIAYVEDVTPGSRVSVTAWAWASGGATTQRFIQWLDPSNAVISTHAPGVAAGFPTATWTLVPVGENLLVPDGAVRMRIIMRRNYSGSIAVAERLLLAAIMIEEAPTAGEYFDGDKADGIWWPEPYSGYAWEGTPGASPSRSFPQIEWWSTSDADVTAYWSVTNEFTNPAPASTTGYATGTGTSAIALVTFGGRNAIRWTTSGTGAAYCNISAGFSVTPGRTYKVIGEFGSSVSRSVGFMVRWLDINDQTVKDELTGTVTTTTSSWTRLSATVTPPKTAVRANVYSVSLTNTSGQHHYLSRLMWYEGDETIEYFDGSTSLPATYTYAWADAANLSSSTRTPVYERDPDVFIWPAGTSAWDFLEPLVASAELRLFCNERREWLLINPSLYAADGVLVVNQDNTIEGTDVVALGDPEIYCTGVSIVYTWTDRNGNERTRTDSAGTGGQVLRVDINRPWPGDGVAAWMLSRRQGQGRVQELTTIGRMFAGNSPYMAYTNPSMQVSTSLPGTADQLGQLVSVEWGLTDGLMNVTTRALTDIIPGSIDALTGTIDALAGTIDSL